MDEYRKHYEELIASIPSNEQSSAGQRFPAGDYWIISMYTYYGMYPTLQDAIDNWEKLFHHIFGRGGKITNKQNFAVAPYNNPAEVPFAIEEAKLEYINPYGYRSMGYFYHIVRE